MTNEEKLNAASVVADFLNGQCTSDIFDALAAKGIPEELGDDPVFLAEIDNQVMRCQSCDWWCETGEIDDDGNCDDCREDEE